MTTTEAPPPISERIKSVQKQLRIAIQNHQMLVLKQKVSPGDSDIRNHISVVQGLIITMGRTQAELLSQFRRESSQNGGSETKGLLGDWREAPKDIPVYKYLPPAETSFEGKKIASWKSKKGVVTLEATSPSTAKKNLKSLLRPLTTNGSGLVIKKIPKVVGGGSVKLSQSVVKGGPGQGVPGGTTLLVKRVEGPSSGKIMLENNSEIKIIYNNKKTNCSGEESLLKPMAKKLQSVLKSKSPDKVGGGDWKEELKLKVTSLEELEVSRSVSGGGGLGGGGKKKRLEEEMEIIPLLPAANAAQPPLASAQPPTLKPNLKPRKRLQPNLFVKSKLRLRTRSASSFLRSRNFDCDSFPHAKGDLSGSSPPRFGHSEDLQPHWLTIDDVGQDSFLRYFGLINREQFAAIKKKKCERKRRSVAGQSSYYNDYLQPLMPKRTYVRKPPTQSITNQVVVETAMEVDDEDEKTVKNCTICQKNGNLEVCHSCSESYHLKCVSSPSGGCPTCNAQHSNIKNIVGANSAGSASSMELIKRYLSSSSASSSSSNASANEKNEVDANPLAELENGANDS